jgi:S-adenosylmethionine synthetase
LRLLAEDRHKGILSKLGPDAKSQVSLEYRDGRPVRATSIVLSTQHDESVNQDDVRAMVIPYIKRVLPDGWMPAADELYINPTGRFVIGGPVGDSGLTGRKIIVDTYGGSAPHGGGAFSGKDPTKVDRSAAYAARYVAKNIVAAGYAERCTLQVSYAIGVSKPISLYVNTHGTSTVDEGAISDAVGKVMNMSPRGIREHLKLNRPIYARTAAYGHFGRKPEPDGGFSWEKLDLVKPLQDILG